MGTHIEPIAKLINHFSKLPGVGAKTAARYAYSIINMKDDEAKEFANAILNVKNNVKFCSVCGNYTDCDPCLNCRHSTDEIICVVSDPKDVSVIEKAKTINCSYHVLHGTISPLASRGPNDIRIKELLERINKNGTREVIMATNPDVEGEATAMYISKLIKPLGVKVTRIAQGVSMGSDIEYADEVTLARAIDDRKEI